MAESTGIELSKKDIRKKILSMILPITTENVLQMMVGFVSMAMIGRIDTFAIAAVGLSMRITQIVWALFKGITTGATVFVAQAYGANDFAKVRKIIHQTLISTIAFVVLIQQYIYWNAPRILTWFGAKEELLENSIIYVRSVSWGLPFVAIMLVVTGALQGMGNARTPMVIAFFMNGANVIISWFIIFGNMRFPQLGIMGAGIATAISQAIAALLGLYALFSKNGVLSSLLNKSFFKFDMKQIGAVYKVGTPAAFESIFWQLCSVFLTKIMLDFGATAMAAHQLGMQAESISYMPAMGFGVAATAFMGQAIGAMNTKLAKEYLKEISLGSILITMVSTIVLWFFPASVMRLLTDQQEVIELGVVYLRLMAVVQIPQNLGGVINGALRGAGYTRIPMVIAGSGLWLVRLPLAYVLSKTMGYGIVGIWIAMTIDLVFRFILGYILYKVKDIYKTVSLVQPSQ